MFILLVTAAFAADSTSTLSFTPWNGAALTFTQDGGALNAAVAGPLGKGWGLSVAVAVPFDLAATPGTGEFSFDADLTRTPNVVQEICKAADVKGCDKLAEGVVADPASAAKLRDALRDACKSQGLTDDDCSTDNLDGSARKAYQDALAANGAELSEFAKKEAARAAARSFLASPLDQLAQGDLAGRTVGSAGLVMHGEMSRFTAYDGTADGTAGNYGDATLNLGAHVGFSSGTASTGKATGGGVVFDASVAGAFASSQPVDNSAPDHPQVAGPPTHALGLIGGLEFVGIGRELSTRDVLPDSTGYAPTLNIAATASVADVLASDILPGLAFDASVTGGLRPTGNGPGLSVGALLHYGQIAGEAGFTVLPVATISGELPDLGATGLKAATKK